MLIVEDELDIADCLEQFFTQRGYSVVSTFSGEEALDWLKERSAEVILIDILLPGLSGIEVLKRAKQIHPRAQVVMATALDQRNFREEAERYGACDYVTKPFDFSDEAWAMILRRPRPFR